MGGPNNMTGCMIFNKDATLQALNECLLKEDYFRQPNLVFPVPETILTPKVLKDHTRTTPGRRPPKRRTINLKT